MTSLDPRAGDVARTCATMIDAHAHGNKPDLETLLQRDDDPLFVAAVAAAISGTAFDLAQQAGMLGPTLIYKIRHDAAVMLMDGDPETVTSIRDKLAGAIDRDAAWIAQLGIDTVGRERAVEITSEMVRELEKSA